MTEKKEIFGISQIQLLRHEIHQPNITLRAKLAIIVEQLNLVKRDFGKNNLELSQRIDQIIDDAEAALSYSTIFASQSHFSLKFSRGPLLHIRQPLPPFPLPA